MEVGGTRALDQVPMPARVARLARTKVGYPIPWFVAELPDGTVDLRVASQEKLHQAVREQLCWVCGQRLGAFLAFVIGPMCAVNRITAEPPTHRDCGQYSAQVCPFLSTPGMRRRPLGRDDTVPAAGAPLDRNPGVALVWVTRTARPVRAPMGNRGLLFHLGDPVETHWYREGRPALRAEVLEAMETGLPALLEACKLDDDPGASERDVMRQYERAMAWLPRGAPGRVGGGDVVRQPG